MAAITRRALALIVTLSLMCGFIGMYGNESYAASKKTHLKETKVTVHISRTYQQKLLDKRGKAIKAAKVKWKSKNPGIAKITKKGKVNPVKKGTAKLTAKYKGKTYKFTVKVTNYYTFNDDQKVRAMIGHAGESTDFVTEEITYWGDFDDYSASSYYITEVRKDLKGAAEWLKKTKKITSKRKIRKCKTNCGYADWNGMVNSLLSKCNKLKGKDLYSMSYYDRIGYASEVLNLVIQLNEAYLECDSWDFANDPL